MKLEKRYPRTFQCIQVAKCEISFDEADVAKCSCGVPFKLEQVTGDAKHWREVTPDPAPEAKAVDVGTEVAESPARATAEGDVGGVYLAMDRVVDSCIQRLSRMFDSLKEATARIATLEADAKLRSEVLAERDEQLKHERAGRADAERRVRELDLHCEEVTAERDNARRTWHTFANISKSSRRIADEYAAELRRQSQAAWMRGDIVTADRIAELIGDALPSQHEAADSFSAVGGERQG